MDEQFDAKVKDLCDLYRDAPDLAQAGERVMSTDELKEKVMGFIDYYNRTMAKPFKWTYQGKVLVA